MSLLLDLNDTFDALLERSLETNAAGPAPLFTFGRPGGGGGSPDNRPNFRGDSNNRPHVGSTERERPVSVVAGGTDSA